MRTDRDSHLHSHISIRCPWAILDITHILYILSVVAQCDHQRRDKVGDGTSTGAECLGPEEKPRSVRRCQICVDGGAALDRVAYLQSRRADTKLCQWLISPARLELLSSSNRRTAYSLSSGASQLVVAGKFGRTKLGYIISLWEDSNGWHLHGDDCTSHCDHTLN